MVSHLILKTPSEQAAPALMRILRSYTASATMLPSPLHDASSPQARAVIASEKAENWAGRVNTSN